MIQPKIRLGIKASDSYSEYKKQYLKRFSSCDVAIIKIFSQTNYCQNEDYNEGN